MAGKFDKPYPAGRSPYQKVGPIGSEAGIGNKALPIRETPKPDDVTPEPAANKKTGNFGPGSTSTGKVAKINRKPK